MRALLVVLTLGGVLAGCTGGAANLPPSPVSSVSRAPSSTPARPATSSAQGEARAPNGPGGQHSTAWRIPHGNNRGIEGFADPISVLPAQPVRLYVSTTAAHFRVLAYRMGWYGGALGRLAWTSPTYPGKHQPGPALVAPATATMAARWAPSLTIDTTGWAPGDYLLRLDGTGHRSRFVPLTVRAASAAGRVVLVNAVTTWQAYNRWGCCDLYQGRDGTFATRSRAVSFDRPYLQESGTGEFLQDELPVVAEAERLGLSLDYVTDLDLQTVPHLLDGARAIVSMGHDEYWSPAMRAALTAARDAGTNLAFLGANAIFRRIRLAATRLGPDRLEIDYKIATEDPLDGRDNSAVTADWPSPPAADPESRLLGDQYGCLLAGSPHVAGVVVDPGNWLFGGVRVAAGEQLAGLIGPEADAIQLAYPTPRPIEVLLHSPIDCPGLMPSHADTSYYVAPSGAAVFDAGSIGWACTVQDACHHRAPNRTGRIVRTVTDNLLRTFAKGPAGLTHPAHDNLAQLGITR